MEVAEASLEFDAGTKLDLYARNNVPEVWVVNLNENVLQFFHSPGNSSYTSSGGKSVGETISPKQFPNIQIDVEKIFGSGT